MLKIFKCKLIIFSLFFFTFSISAQTISASEVPFEVTKTYVVAEGTTTQGITAVAEDGILYDANAIGKNLSGPPKKGEFDNRTLIPVNGVKYILKFWNVGEMGGDKSFFVFKSNYGKAKLIRKYILGQAYQYAVSEKEFFGLHSLEKVNAEMPDVTTEFSTDLTFSGGPYGTFYYTDSKGAKHSIAHIVDGKTITFDNIPELAENQKVRLLMNLSYLTNVHPQITNTSAFEKWMEILNAMPTCTDPSDPKTDSGWRFNDFNGEVMVRPCDDEDAWYGAELDMVLHRNDHIRTGEDSTCELMGQNMSLFLMNKPESEIILNYTQDNTKINLIWGKLKANVKELINHGTMTVEMSQAVCGIKGTIFVVEDNGKTSTLKVLDGEVEFTSKKTGKSILVHKGEKISADNNGLKQIKKINIEKENDTWKDKESMIKDMQAFKKQSQKTNSNDFIKYIITSIIFLIIIFSILIIKKLKTKKIK